MKQLRSQSGQMTIEMILLATVLMSISVSFSRFVQNNGLVANLVEAPWKPIQGMIENGVWQAGDKALRNHPSMNARHSTNIADEPND